MSSHAAMPSVDELRDVTPLTRGRAMLGESPRWSPERDSVLTVDVRANWLQEIRLSEGVSARIDLPDMVAGIASYGNGSIALFGRAGQAWICDLSDQSVVPAFPALADAVDSHDFNDVAADPDGSVLCGTMPKDGEPGALYRLDIAGHVEILLADVFGSNGIAFAPDGSRCYYADSADRVIHTFERSSEGGLRYAGELLRFPDDAGRPDGLAVDADGRIWCAMWDGWSVEVLSAHGDRLGRVGVPTACVTSVCFAGQDRRQMVVTSARSDPDDGTGGRVFLARTDAIGVAASTIAIAPQQPMTLVRKEAR